MQITQDLQWRISQLPDEELLEMLTLKRVEHGQPALDLAAKELMRRGVDLPAPLPQPEPTPPITSSFAQGEEERRKRKDQLIQLAGVYAFLALIAWGFYTDNSDPTILAERVFFWFHAVFFAGSICVLLFRKLLDKT
jgi:hypothetical protein